jgi:hypothetical protein
VEKSDDDVINLVNVILEAQVESAVAECGGNRAEGLSAMWKLLELGVIYLASDDSNCAGVRFSACRAERRFYRRENAGLVKLRRAWEARQ